MRWFKIKLILLLSLGFITAQKLHAVPACTVSVIRNLNFGNYKPFDLSPDNSTAKIQMKCTGRGRVNYQISLGSGINGSYTPRKMTLSGSASDYLNYNIFTKSNRTTIWGNGFSGTSTRQFRKSSPFTKKHTLFGQIPASQITAKIGSYSDIILVTINY